MSDNPNLQHRNDPNNTEPLTQSEQAALLNEQAEATKKADEQQQ